MPTTTIITALTLSMRKLNFASKNPVLMKSAKLTLIRRLSETSSIKASDAIVLKITSAEQITPINILSLARMKTPAKIAEASGAKRAIKSHTKTVSSIRPILRRIFKIYEAVKFDAARFLIPQDEQP